MGRSSGVLDIALGELRGLFDMPRGEGLWRRVAAVVDIYDGPELEVLIDYALVGLKDWPIEAKRVCLQRWVSTAPARSAMYDRWSDFPSNDTPIFKSDVVDAVARNSWGLASSLSFSGFDLTNSEDISFLFDDEDRHRHIKELVFWRCELRRDDVRRIARSACQLESLVLDRLSGEQITRVIRELVSSNSMPELRRLGLSFSSLSSNSVAALLGWSTFGAIDVLDLSRCSMVSNDVVDIARFGRRLWSSVDLSGNTLSGDDFSRVLAFGRSWKRLALNGVSSHEGALRDHVARALDEDLGANDLVHLEVSHNNLGPDFIELLRAWDVGSRLEHLDLGFNRLGDEGVQALLGSEWANLESLTLSSNDLTDESVRAMVQSKCLVGVRHLELYDNQLTDEGVRLLLDSDLAGRLRYLSIYGDRLTRDVLEIVRRADKLDDKCKECVLEDLEVGLDDSW